MKHLDNSAVDAYRPPRNSNSSSDSLSRCFNKIGLSLRIAAGILSLVTLIFAYGGNAAWSLAIFYSGGQPLERAFYGVLVAAIMLFFIAAYWSFFALLGYKLLSKELNYGVLSVTFSLQFLRASLSHHFFRISPLE